MAEKSHVDIKELKPAASKPSEKWVRLPNEREPDTGGEHRYIVMFDDESLPLYDGGVSGLAAAKMDGGKLNTSSAAARAYVSHLQRKQQEMVRTMSASAGSIEVERSHQHALNAVTVRMSEVAANKPFCSSTWLHRWRTLVYA